MKILATFDGSVLAESVIPRLTQLCTMPGVELVLLRVGAMPHGMPRSGVQPAAIAVTAGGTTPLVARTPDTSYAENKEQAVERTRATLDDYLLGVTERLPSGVPCRVASILDDDPRSAIVRFAITEQPDMIVMATHGHTGLVHVLFGDVAESVVKSGVAPVLLVQPDEIRTSKAKAQS